MALTAERFIFRLLNFWVLHSLALVIRLFLVGYGIYQDKTMVVKYTDIDYHVFTDAARFVTQGESPYNRSTYRYTPLLAWILVPNIYVTPHFGKLLFVTCDVLSGVLLYRILSLQGLSSNAAGCFSAVWLLNPLPIGVSTRGSAEAVLSLLVLSTLLCLELKRLFMAAFFYALSVHMKIYPVTYALPIALYISSRGSLEGKGRSLFRILRGLFNKNVVMFAAVAGVVFLALTIAFYYM